ncbi:MAG: ABC transporter substrate-binding protein [Burkholderiaceae bacterium]|jgi:branched-chain amino acid transport system substrate-binding protein
MLFALLFLVHPAWGQIKVGVVVSATGPAASLGIPQQNTVALLPKEMGGKKVEYILLDDASDTTTAVKDVRKLISEDRVDVIIGSSVTPNALAMTDPAAEGETPVISLAASIAIITPMDAKKAWVFKTPQNDALMASAVVDHMVAHNVHTVAFIALTDSYGQSWITETTKLCNQNNIKILANESYQPTDPSTIGQVLKVIAAKPDAVLIASRGTPAVLPQKQLRERGYTGPIYQTHGVANNDYLRVGGRDVEGTILPAGPVLVASQLPDSHPSKQQALGYQKAYEAAYGANSTTTFGAHLWDASLLLERAVPLALKAGEPGTPAFRHALRDALEGVQGLVISQGVMNLSKSDHNGMDQRARVMVTVENGKWKLLQ